MEQSKKFEAAQVCVITMIILGLMWAFDILWSWVGFILISAVTGTLLLYMLPLAITKLWNLAEEIYKSWKSK